MVGNMIGNTAIATGIWHAAATIVVSVVLFVLVVHFASHDVLSSHFDKFIIGVFTFGTGVLASLFVSHEKGFHLPDRETLTRRAPAGLAALAFVVGAQIWWGQWSRYYHLSAALADVCEKAKGAPESSVNKIILLTNAQRLAEEINSLWIKPRSVEVTVPCDQ